MLPSFSFLSVLLRQARCGGSDVFDCIALKSLAAAEAEPGDGDVLPFGFNYRKRRGGREELEGRRGGNKGGERRGEPAEVRRENIRASLTRRGSFMRSLHSLISDMRLLNVSVELKNGRESHLLSSITPAEGGWLSDALPEAHMAG